MATLEHLGLEKALWEEKNKTTRHPTKLHDHVQRVSQCIAAERLG